MISWAHALVCQYAALPWIMTAISAAGAGDAAYNANKQRQIQQDAIKKQAAIAAPAAAAGQQLVQQGQGAIGQGLNFYSDILSDPRNATAPQQNQVSSMYAGQAANIRNKYPRGGFGPSQAQDTANQSMRAREDIIQKGPLIGAQGLTAGGQAAAGLGFQGQGLGAGIYGNAFQQGLSGQAQQQNLLGQAGQGLFNSYQAYLLQQANNSPSTQGNGSGGANNFNFATAFTPNATPNGGLDLSAGFPGMPGSNLFTPPPNSGSSGVPTP